MSLDLHPITLWTLRTADGRNVRAMLFPRGLEATLAWFIDDHPAGVEDCIDEDEAMRRGDELRAKFEASPGEDHA